MIVEDALQAAKFNVLGTLIECVLDGGFLVLMIITLVSTFRKTITSQVVRIHVVGFMMFCLASVHVISNVLAIIKGFGGGEGLRERYNSPISRLQQATLMLQTILGDGSWLYRLHIVWEGNKRVTYPFLFLSTSTAGLGIYTIVTVANIGTFTLREAQVACIALLALALASSVGYTTLITVRLCCVNRKVKNHRYSSGLSQARNILEDFIILVIESGVIYTTFLLIALLSFTCKTYVGIIPYKAVIQVLGFVYYMMLLQSTLRGNSHPESRNRGSQHAETIELPSHASEAPPPVLLSGSQDGRKQCNALAE